MNKFLLCFALFYLSCNNAKDCIPCQTKNLPVIYFQEGKINHRAYVGGVCGCKFDTPQGPVDTDECRYAVITYDDTADSLYILSYDSIFIDYYFKSLPSCKTKTIRAFFTNTN